MGNEQTHDGYLLPKQPDTNLSSLLGRWHAVTGDRPAMSDGARQAELNEWAKVHKTYTTNYAKRQNPYKIVQPNRRGSTARPSDK